MAEEATRPFDHRAVHGDPDGLASRALEGLKPLLMLAFNGIRRGLAEIRQALMVLAELLQVMFRPPVGGDQPAGAPNRFENIAGSDEEPVKVGSPWPRFGALSVRVITLGKFALRIAAECVRVVLILGWGCGLAAYRVACSRAVEFRRYGKVELSKGEAAVALLVLAFFGFSLAWLVADTDPRVERFAGGPPADRSALPSLNNVHVTDPIIPTMQLAELLTERPSLEGRLYWAEQPMPMPILASLPDPRIRLATTARPMPFAQQEFIEVTIAGAPAVTVGSPTDKPRPTDVVAPPSVSPRGEELTSNDAPAPLTVAPTEVANANEKPSPPPVSASVAELASASSIAPEPQLPASVAVNTNKPKLAQAAPLPRPEPSASAGRGSTATYQVQLVAVRARDQALVMWENLLGKHQDVLGNLDPDISSRRTRNRNLVYRLRAGPIDSRSEASALCTTLSKRKVDCLVVRASG